MFLLFLILLGVLFILIGIWKKKVTYGKVLIGLGALLIGIFFFGPFGIFYSCERYSNYLRNELQKINKPCENSDDCKLISYFPCKPYCINKDVDLSAFYSSQKKRPWSCPLYRCIAPEVKWRCVCENNTCTLKEKEAIEQETANWETCTNEEYGFEIKYPNEWVKDESTLFPDYMEEAVASAPSCTFFVPKTKRIPEDVWISASTRPCKTESCDPREEMEEPYRKTVKQSTIGGRPVYTFDDTFEAERNLSYILINEEKTQQGWLTLSIHHGRQTGTEYLLDEEIESELQIFQQMLSTFRFLEVKEIVIPKDKESCEAREGRWGRHFLLPGESCILPTSDAGKSCSDSDQCESACTAPGKCYEWKPIPGGCYFFVENGKIQGELCID